MTEKELQILAIQAPSTRRCLERSPDLDLTWLNRKIPKEAQVITKDGSVDLNIRAISSAEFTFYTEERKNQGMNFESARATYLNSKNLNEKLRDLIDTPHVYPDEEKRERAIEAFMKCGTWHKIKEKFKEIMFGVKKEDSYAEKMAASMKAIIDEK